MTSTKVILVLVIWWQCTSAQVSERFFRNDYTYIDSTESFYKIHTIQRTWIEAKKVCAAEGARLFYPDDTHEADVITDFLKKTQAGFSWVFVGASAILAKGVYETTDGVPVQNLYHNWAQGEPNNGNQEDCVILRREGTLDDVSCVNENPFICKKTLASLQWNERCNMPHTDYEYNNESGRCYKFHLDPKNWIDAYATCSAEQSYLAVIDSQAEADYLLDLTRRAPKEDVVGDYLRGTVLVGFHNRTNEGWINIKGVPLMESGYSQWANGEPNNANVNGEQCGSLYYGGGLNDISCSTKCFFICEHDVQRPSRKHDGRIDSMNSIDGSHVL